MSCLPSELIWSGLLLYTRHGHSFLLVHVNWNWQRKYKKSKSAAIETDFFRSWKGIGLLSTTGEIKIVIFNGVLWIWVFCCGKSTFRFTLFTVILVVINYIEMYLCCTHVHEINPWTPNYWVEWNANFNSKTIYFPFRDSLIKNPWTCHFSLI